MNKNEGGALRYDNEKVRMDLIPAFANIEFGKVLTIGAKKYGDNNWQKGMKWSRVLGSLERHLYAIKKGEDFDPETGLLHSAHVMTNAAFLTEYYKIFPQGDDRQSDYLKPKRIGIDIDDVLADFMGAYCEKYNLQRPNAWEFDAEFVDRYKVLQDDPEFFLNLKTILSPEDLPFEPVAYITSRPSILSTVTLQWLFEINHYPIAPLIFVKDKLPAIKEMNIERFIDDKVATFIHLNLNGVLCYLFDSSHNQRIDVGHKRITKETIKNVL